MYSIHGLNILLVLVVALVWLPIYNLAQVMESHFSSLSQQIYIYFFVCFTVPGVIGCLQALEAIKVASAVGDPLSGRMLLLDALSGRIRIVCLYIITVSPLNRKIVYVFQCRNV